VIEVRYDEAIARPTEHTHQAQAVGSAGDTCDDRAVFGQSALFKKGGFDVIKHGNHYNTIIFKRCPI